MWRAWQMGLTSAIFFAIEALLRLGGIVVLDCVPGHELALP